jgi:hypothetical protein
MSETIVQRSLRLAGITSRPHLAGGDTSARGLQGSEIGFSEVMMVASDAAISEVVTSKSILPEVISF